MPKIIFKADWLGIVIAQVPFAKPKNEVQIFNRATLSGFGMREFTTKEVSNTKKQVLLLISLGPWFAFKNKKVELFSMKKTHTE